MSGIYVHIPFCKKACSYCNFHFSTTYHKYRDDLIKALIQEIELTHQYLPNKNIESIYFGGGTPSLLNRKEIESIFEILQRYYKFDKSKIEITLEANPDDLTFEKLRDLKETGINRLSIGIQSFHEVDLLLMNRSHNAVQAIECIELSKKVGFENISIDLIFGLPNSNIDLWKQNLNQALNLKIQHLSVYNLTIEPKTRLAHQVKTNKIKVSDDKLNAFQFYTAKEILEQNGFNQYEISNYAYEENIAIHNTNYWKSKTYLGIGPGAHSYDGKSRHWNISNNTQYIQLLQDKQIPFETELLSDTDIYNEYLITRLRTIWGISKNFIAELDSQYKEHFIQQAKPHISNENLLLINEKYRISKKGLIIADAIISDLLYID